FDGTAPPAVAQLYGVSAIMPPYSQSLWDSAKREARALMAAAATSSQGTMTYGEVASKLVSISVRPDDPIFHELLGEVAREENGAGRGILSAVVVRKGGDKRPGSGFFRLAKELGRDTSDHERCWLDELKRVRTAYSSSSGLT